MFDDPIADADPGSSHSSYTRREYLVFLLSPDATHFLVDRLVKPLHPLGVFHEDPAPLFTCTTQLANSQSFAAPGVQWISKLD